MRKINIIIAVLLAVFAAGVIFVSCGGGSKIDSAIVGKWRSDSQDGAGYLEFTSDGRYIFLGTVISTYSASDGTITTFSNSPSTPGQRLGSATYTVSGNTLTISNPEVSSGLSLVAGEFHRP